MPNPRMHSDARQLLTCFLFYLFARAGDAYRYASLGSSQLSTPSWRDMEFNMMQTPKHSDELGTFNAAILALGEALPQVRLKDGTTVQTGTVAAMLANTERFNTGERGQVERDLELAIPTLVRIGLFELFRPDEWVDLANPGRTFVGLQAKKFIQAEHSEA